MKIEWIEVLSSERKRLEELGQRLGIHPLALEDCFHTNQRAKFDDFENQQLLVWFMVAQDRIYELEFVILPQQVLLVTQETPPLGASWYECLKLRSDPSDSAHLVYQALDHAMDLTAEQIRPTFDAIDDFEEKLFGQTCDPRELLKLKRKLSRWEFALAPLPSVADQFQRATAGKTDLKWRLRDLHDHCIRIHQRILFSLGQVTSAMDMYWGYTSKRTNDRIKTLTVLACIAVPLTLWCSFWGMNFTAIPFDSRSLFLAAILLMIASSGGFYLVLKLRGYWEED